MSRSEHQPSAPWRHIDDWTCVPMSVKRVAQVESEPVAVLAAIDPNEYMCDGNCPMCDVPCEVDVEPAGASRDGRRWSIGASAL